MSFYVLLCRRIKKLSTIEICACHRRGKYIDDTTTAGRSLEIEIKCSFVPLSRIIIYLIYNYVIFEKCQHYFKASGKMCVYSLTYPYLTHVLYIIYIIKNIIKLIGQIL